MSEYYNKLIDIYNENVSKPGLSRVTELLKRLGNPQNSLKCIHVAGTNGKGSTCSYIESALRCAGYKTGLFTSPHIYDIREYVKVDNEVITEEKIDEHAKEVLNIAKEMVESGFDHPTFFELMLAVAFDCFSDSEIDVAIIETGMGGELDATNVIYPILSVITPISLDHINYLGDTIHKIAQQKAGIIKPDVPVVSAVNQHKSAKKVFKKRCKDVKSDFIDADEMKLSIYDLSMNGTKFLIEDDGLQYRFSLKNVGRHQAENAATAFYALSVIGELGFEISYSAIKEGINSTIMDSRIQIYEDEKIIIDASHNPEGVYELGYVINELLGDEKKVLLCSVFTTKDIKEMIYEYSKFTDYAAAVKSNHPLSSDAESLAGEFKAQNVECDSFDGIETAVKKAMETKGEDGYLIVSGSFSMISDVKKALDVK